MNGLALVTWTWLILSIHLDTPIKAPKLLVIMFTNYVLRVQAGKWGGGCRRKALGGFITCGEIASPWSSKRLTRNGQIVTSQAYQ